MTLLRGFLKPDAYRGGFVAIGNFDGVHRGHQELIGRLRHHASRDNVPSVVLTFDPPPVQLLRPDLAPPRLSTVERKATLLRRYGIDCVIAYPTSEDLLSLSPTDFFREIIVEQLAARGLVEGPNFHFGRGRAGNVKTLAELCDQHGMTLEVVEPQPLGDDDETMISSTLLRGLIADGDVREAIHLMGHPYQIEGEVTTGDRRGRELGFPTANLSDVPTLLPAEGVYAAFTSLNGTEYPVALNIGGNPTFGEDRRKVEAHLLDFEGDLYGRRLQIDLLGELRPVRTFASREELMRQLATDITATRDLFDNR